MSVLTDWQSYSANSKVTISGALTGSDATGGTTVSIKVTDPSGTVIFSDAVEATENKVVEGGVEYTKVTYETSFTLPSTAAVGDYTVEVSALGKDATASFKVIQPTGHLLVYVMGGAIAVVVGVIVIRRRRS